MGELPGGELARGVLEAVGDCFVGGRSGESREGLAVERVGGGGEVEVVGMAAAGDVDVGLGPSGGGIDPAGGHVAGGALDGVAGEGVGVVDTDLGATSGGAVVVEERPWQFDRADPVEGDDERVPATVVRVGAEGDDGPKGTVADVRLALALGVQVPVGGAGGDAVADGESSVFAGDDLLGADLAVDLAEPVGEAVELPAGGVSSIDHRVVESVAVGVPPAAEDVAVHGQIVADDVEVAGGFEVGDRFVDASLA